MEIRNAIAMTAAAAMAAAALLCASCAREGADGLEIGVILRSSDDPFSAAARKAMSAATTGEAELSFSYSGLRAAEQSSLAEDSLEKGKSVLAIDAVDSLSARSAIAGAKAKGVPLVFMDCLPSGDAMLSWDKVFYVGSPDREAGAIMGQLLAEHRKRFPASDRNGDGSLQYAFISGDPGLRENAERSLGIAEALEAAGLKSSRLLEAETNGAIADARRKTALALEQFGDRIEAIACADWIVARGAIEACERAGRLKGSAPIAIVAVHRSASSPELRDELKSGRLIGAAALDAEAIGKASLSMAMILAEGKDPQKSGHRLSDAKFLWIPYKKVSREEAAP